MFVFVCVVLLVCECVVVLVVLLWVVLLDWWLNGGYCCMFEWYVIDCEVDVMVMYEDDGVGVCIVIGDVVV